MRLRRNEYRREQATEQVSEQVTPQVKNLLESLTGEMTRAEITESIGLKDRMHFSREYLQPALAAGLVQMTIPDKPRSSQQKYRLTEKGSSFHRRMISLSIWPAHVHFVAF